MRMDMTTIPAQVAEARHKFRDYIAILLEKYAQRREQRQRLGLQVVNFVGHGRAGKDESAMQFAKMTGAHYGGATSEIVAPMLAWSCGVEPEIAFARRHENRTYWFEWCNEFRRVEPSLLPRMLLGAGDICVGTRSWLELQAAVNEQVIDKVVWINRLGIDPDPTMEYDAGHVLSLPCWSWIDNNKDVHALRQEVQKLAVSLCMYQGDNCGN